MPQRLNPAATGGWKSSKRVSDGAHVNYSSDACVEGKGMREEKKKITGLRKAGKKLRKGKRCNKIQRRGKEGRKFSLVRKSGNGTKRKRKEWELGVGRELEKDEDRNENTHATLKIMVSSSCKRRVSGITEYCGAQRPRITDLP